MLITVGSGCPGLQRPEIASGAHQQTSPRIGSLCDVVYDNNIAFTFLSPIYFSSSLRHEYFYVFSVYAPFVNRNGPEIYHSLLHRFCIVMVLGLTHLLNLLFFPFGKWVRSQRKYSIRIVFVKLLFDS